MKLRSHPIAVLTVSCVLALALPAPCRAQAAGAPPQRKSLAPLLQPFVENHTLAGAVVLVADKEKVLSLEAVGWMDIAAQKPMRTDCLFWAASQSKPITAAAFMILVDEGKVSLDDPVEKFLPEFKGQMVIAEKDKDHVLLRRPKHPITIRNVLSHTSGLPFKSGIEEPTLDLFPLATRVRSYAMLPLEFEPDTKYQYSNAGINTAGRIIEVIAKMPFEEFLAQRICEPLGMKDTTFWPSSEQLTRLAKAYKHVKEGLEECPVTQLKYPLDDRQRQPMPAGGLFSTANDLSIFYRMIANNGTFAGKRILSEKAVEQMTTKQTGELPTPYGLGINADPKSFGHGGAYNTTTRYHRERQLITVFLGQHATWPKENKSLIPTVEKAALEAFAPAAPAPRP